jgi:hypothetical protein
LEETSINLPSGSNLHGHLVVSNLQSGSGLIARSYR